MSNPQEDFSLPLFTRSLILELSSTIISHSEERKDLMASLEQKRKKWIMWGKGTEEKKKQKFRKQWDVQPKQTDVVKALEQVFEDASLEVEQNAPIGIVIQQCVYFPVRNQFKVVNRALLHMCF